MTCGPARTVAARGAPETVGPGPSRVFIDRERWQVTRDGAPVHLTRKAFSLLLALVDAGGAVVSREALYAAVWGDGFDGFAETLSTHICVLRRALGKGTVRSVRGVGYAVREDLATRWPVSRPAADRGVRVAGQAAPSPLQPRGALRSHSSTASEDWRDSARGGDRAPVTRA
jgi:DNA-binding winged helix-turn-helix (wHTH) protein